MTLSKDIENRADAGDVEAMTCLGKRALVGQAGARTPADGARLLLAAGEKGSAEADAVLSVVIAVDAKEPADWSLALGFLQRAAERGFSSAREQLCLLAPDRGLANAARSGGSDGNTWEELRDTIDMPGLLKSPPVDRVFNEPRIGIASGFASIEECRWMIARGRTRLVRAEVFDQSYGGEMLDKARSNSAMLFGFLDMDFVFAVLRARISNAVSLPRTGFEETNVLHYAVGQEFARHFDFFDPSQPANAAEVAAKGQRIGTFLVYLNEGFDGAETDFPAIRWRHKGRIGDALFFMNVDAAGKPDRRTMHAGLPPLRGEKWLLSQWIRGMPGVGL